MGEQYIGNRKQLVFSRFASKKGRTKTSRLLPCQFFLRTEAMETLINIRIDLFDLFIKRKQEKIVLNEKENSTLNFM